MSTMLLFFWYSYSKNYQSESYIQQIQCSDWTILEMSTKHFTQMFYDCKASTLFSQSYNGYALYITINIIPKTIDIYKCMFGSFIQPFLWNVIDRALLTKLTVNRLPPKYLNFFSIRNLKALIKYDGGNGV